MPNITKWRHGVIVNRILFLHSFWSHDIFETFSTLFLVYFIIFSNSFIFLISFYIFWNKTFTNEDITLGSFVQEFRKYLNWLYRTFMLFRKVRLWSRCVWAETMGFSFLIWCCFYLLFFILALILIFIQYEFSLMWLR